VRDVPRQRLREILSVHFVNDLGWAAASIGLVLALRQFVQQTLTVVSGALFDSPTAAAMAALTTDDERLQFYSVRGVITSLGMTIGPLIGSALLKVDFALVAYLSAGLYAVVLIVTCCLMSKSASPINL
jgi:DHA1 family multidrug resistance protein-like MFS transporter